MKLMRISLAVFAAVALAVPANSQELTSALSVEAVVARAHGRYADCIVARDVDTAKHALAEHVSMTRAEAMLSLATRFESCDPGSGFFFRPTLLAGAIAERLAIAGVEPFLEAETRAVPAFVDNDQRDDIIASCLTRAAPSEIDALFATRAGSLDEARAIESLLAMAGSCVPSSNLSRLEQRGKRALLRAYLAIARLTIVTLRTSALSESPNREQANA